MKKHTISLLLALLVTSPGCVDLSTAHQGGVAEQVDTTSSGTIVERTAQAPGEEPSECVDGVFTDPCQLPGEGPSACDAEGSTNPWAWVPPSFDPDAPLELAWFHTGDASGGNMNLVSMGGGSLDFSPNSGLLHTSSSLDFEGENYIHTRDGVSGFQGPQPGDLGWSSRLGVEDGGDVVLRAHIAGHEIHRFSPETPDGLADWTVSTYSAVLTPWGEGALSLHCFMRDEEAVLEAHSWSAWSGQLIAKADLSFLGFDCASTSPGDSSFMFFSPAPMFLSASPDGAHALVVMHHVAWSGLEPKIVRIGLMDGAVTTASLPGGQSDWGSSVIYSLEFHPQGDRFAFVTGDAKLHLWSLESLEPIEEPRQAGIVMLNNLSYMPTDVSPLAWSPDGATLAVVGASGQIELWHESREEPVAVLQAPDPPDDFNVHQGWGAWSGPAAVAFSPDGTSVAVRFQHGIALWRAHDDCPAHVTHQEGEVLLDGPTSLEVGQMGLFQATHQGHDVHSHQFFVDGEPVTAASWSRELEWAPSEAGVFEVRVEIDDGVHVAVNTLTLEVSEAP